MKTTKTTKVIVPAKLKLPKELKDFRFADPLSSNNAVLAYSPDRPSAFLVTGGGPGSGKSTLIRKCLEHNFGRAAVTPMPRTENQLRQASYEAAQSGYIWIDNPRCKERELLVALDFFSVAEFKFRRPFTCTELKAKNAVVIFISGNFDKISMDLSRRVEIIVLKPNPTFAK